MAETSAESRPKGSKRHFFCGDLCMFLIVSAVMCWIILRLFFGPHFDK